MSTLSIPLDAEARLELASMAYSRWCKAWDNAKIIKSATWESQGKFCPKEDWALYHADQMKSIEEELNKSFRIREQICKFSPLMDGME